MIDAAQHTWRTLTPAERRRFVLLCTCDIAIHLVDLAFLAALIWIVQAWTQPVEVRAAPAAPFALRSWLLLPVFFMAFLLKNGAAFAVARAQNAFAGKVALRLSRQALEAYQQIPFDRYVYTDSAAHIRSISFQPLEFCQYLLAGLQGILTQCVLIAVAIGAILLYDGRLFLLLLGVLLPPAAATFYGLRKRIARARIGIRNSNEVATQFLNEALRGYVEGSVHGAHPFLAARFTEARGVFARHFFGSLSLQALPPRIIETFAVGGLLLLLWLARSEALGPSLLITAGAFLAAAYKIIPGLVKVINLGGLMRAYAFTAAAAPAPRRSTDDAPSVRSLWLEHISFSYGASPVLRDLSVQAEAGDLVGISAPSGTGKSTLINLLLGFLEADAGTIRVNGAMRNATARQQLWPTVAYVPQQPFVLHDTMLRNILLSDEAPDEDRLRRALADAGFDAVLDAWPDGLQAIVAEGGRNLSGGQLQRLCLARALYRDATLLLLDEPASELDAESEKNLLRCLRRLATGGRIVLLITHRRQSLSYCTHTWTLHEPATTAAALADARFSGVGR
ncbi:ABC transporter ATP-binding protein [Flaviaesturariibacter amylovorans]|uniref:ABC transporter ATP-binding protein n=1 Tax=Flaviaesturariibacter amylovorans TaxID=1084520 RepID=A0ABP8HED9_9BACT